MLHPVVDRSRRHTRAGPEGRGPADRKSTRSNRRRSRRWRDGRSGRLERFPRAPDFQRPRTEREPSSAFGCGRTSGSTSSTSSVSGSIINRHDSSPGGNAPCSVCVWPGANSTVASGLRCPADSIHQRRCWGCTPKFFNSTLKTAWPSTSSTLSPANPQFSRGSPVASVRTLNGDAVAGTGPYRKSTVPSPTRPRAIRNAPSGSCEPSHGSHARADRAAALRSIP